MTTGIATFHLNYNYGAALQQYALFKTVEQFGQKAYILDIPVSDTKNSHPQWNDFLRFNLGPYRYARMALRNTIEFTLKPFKKDTFLAFEQEHLRIGKLPGTSGAPAYDFLICGSDQVWNPQVTAGDPRFFLQFDSPSTKARIAYAPSFGANDEVSAEFLPLLKNYLESIDILSCREKEGCNLVEQLSGRTCPHIADPVMLLSEEEWQNLAKPPQRPPDGKYVFCYDMRRQTLLREVTSRISRKTGAPTYLLEGFRGKKGWRSPIGPEEFLWLIQNAECVTTNSFHCAVFSILFRKPLRIIYPATMITRLKELLERLQLTALVASKPEDAEMPVCWNAEGTIPLIEAERTRGREFLRNALAAKP